MEGRFHHARTQAMTLQYLSFPFAMLIAAQGALAESSDMPLQPLPLNAEDVNYTGTWRYSTMNHEVSGMCPNGQPMSGELSITQEDALAQVLVVSGAVCNPAFSCVYSGLVEEGDLLVANSGIVDDEGGQVTNELRLFFFSEVSAGGASVSVYTHPEGFTCSWTHTLSLSRPEEG